MRQRKHTTAGIAESTACTASKEWKANKSTIDSRRHLNHCPQIFISSVKRLSFITLISTGFKHATGLDKYVQELTITYIHIIDKWNKTKNYFQNLPGKDRNEVKDPLYHFPVKLSDGTINPWF